MSRRRAPVRGASVLLAAVALAGCAGSADNESMFGPGPSVSAAPSTAAKSAPPALPSAAPSPTEAPGLIPLAPDRPAAEFKGDENEFVRRVRDTLTEDKVKTDLSDSRLLRFGREFCSVLSGGGLLSDKVDHWAVFRGLANGPEGAIFLASDVLCKDQADAYERLLLTEIAPVPTAAERADLARFITALDEPDLVAKVKAIEDSDLAGDAEKACDLDFDSEWWDSAKVARLESSLPKAARMAYVVGLVTAYCPDEAGPMVDSLEDYAD